MNIYLDVDGVLLANEKHAAPHADKFLQTVVTKYPQSTFWLTTYVRAGENRVKEVLAPHLHPETVLLLDHVQPAEWTSLKTEGIDFSEQFLWFDDDLWVEELEVLLQHKATHNFVRVDLFEDPDQLKSLINRL